MSADIDAELAALARDVEGLDRSYASIDRVETYLLEKASAKKRVTLYVGATLIAQAGGRWIPAPDRDDGALAVTGTREAPGLVFVPSRPVWEAMSWRVAGWTRDRTEVHDIALQRRVIAELTKDVKATLAQLEADATELAGAPVGPLDGSPALDRYAPALARMRAYGGTLDLRRRFRRGLAIGIGALLQAEVGPAEWTVEDEPRDIDLGAWTLFGIRLSNTVARQDPGKLRTSIEKMIEKRRNQKPAPPKAKAKVAPAKVRLGKWFVLCPKDRALPLKDVLRKVEMPSDAKCRVEQGILVVTIGAHEVQVGLTTEPVVLAEAAEFADEHCQKPAQRRRIATYDARYVISWHLADSEHVFDTYYTIACRLAEAVGGVTFDPMERCFVEA